MQTVVHRDLARASDLRRVFAECVTVVGGVLIILGVAVGLTNYLIGAQVPARLLEWTGAHIDSRLTFLLGLNLFLLVVGCLMDIFSATVVVAPLLRAARCRRTGCTPCTSGSSSSRISSSGI